MRATDDRDDETSADARLRKRHSWSTEIIRDPSRPVVGARLNAIRDFAVSMFWQDPHEQA
jgi:hypothetical protein